MEYEVYVEEFHVTEWKDGAVYETESFGHKWIPEEVRNNNIPRESNIIYAAANDEFAKNNMTIRRVK